MKIDPLDPPDELQQALFWAAEFLPAQGPLTAFVHHNTLHAFQSLPFEEAVLEAGRVYGCNAYMPSQWYRGEMTRGRIGVDDLDWALARRELPPATLPKGVSQRCLHLALLHNPIHRLGPERLRWHLNETGARWRFRSELPVRLREQLCADTRAYVDNLSGAAGQTLLRDLAGEFQEEWAQPVSERLRAASERTVAQVLWTVCVRAVDGIRRPGKATGLRRHRDVVLAQGGPDIDRLVNPVLIRWCAAFLDQGVAHVQMPGRHLGLFAAVRSLYSRGILPTWLRRLPTLLAEHEDAWESIGASLAVLGVGAGEQGRFLRSTLLVLKGWAGMVYQAQLRPDRMPFVEVPARLEDFCALRLLLERCALGHSLLELGHGEVPLQELRSRLAGPPVPDRQGLTLAYHLFQVCQFLGLGAGQVSAWSNGDVENLFHELDTFSSARRREILHAAYERHYEVETLDALSAHQPHPGPENAAFQAIFCLDDREESTRRHLEEISPDCQTFGTLGFFGVPMYFKAVHEPHPRALCPVAFKPRHLVEEVAVEAGKAQQLATVRRSLGTVAAHVHTGSLMLTWGSLLSSALGIFTSVPSILRVLFPRRTDAVSRRLRERLRPQETRLHLLRETEPAAAELAHGFSVAEMADIVARLLQEIGLTTGFAPLVLLIGHGSSSLNNPHEAAYDCGACGGGRGGPNARVFALMANLPEVRRALSERGLCIPESTRFVGAFHNTCDDQLELFDIEPAGDELLNRSVAALQQARARDAQERCRRFESAAPRLSPLAALAHVAERAADLAQPRPELGHATNAWVLVGRRARTRGLFLDRRAFLASYDPTQDDPEGRVLERILDAVLPVGAGINLEYFFSRIDNAGYGCGTKLPHNITSLLGVMEGHSSDLRTGLPWQMVEIHEPMRLLVVVEACRATMEAVTSRRPDIARWALNRWIRLAILDPHSQAVQRFTAGDWEPHQRRELSIPRVEHSTDWFQSKRQHLGYAEIDGD